MFLKYGKQLFGGAAVLIAAVLLFMHSGNGTNAAFVYQAGPAGGDARTDVKHWGGFTIIQRRDRSGNSTTIIQQDHNAEYSN